MKKLFLTMLAVAATATSFAQNADALKQVMSAAKRSDAVKIMKEQGASMSAPEKAKAYSHIVDMAVKDNGDAQTKAIMAQGEDKVKAQTKQYKAAYDAVKYAMEANVPDNEPNEKGQVKPKFKKSNVSKTVSMRKDLMGADEYIFNNQDWENGTKWYGILVESHNNPLYADNADVKQDNIAIIEYYAAAFAYNAKDYKKSAKFAKMCAETGDTTVSTKALNMELDAYNFMKQNGELSQEDYIKKMKQAYKANPTNSDVFGKYIGALYTANMKEEADKVLADRLKSDPNDLMANAYMGQNAQEAADKASDDASAIQKYTEACDAYSKVLASKPDFDAVKYNLAVCTRANAVLLKGQKKPYKDLIEKAKKLFQEIQAKDPEEATYKTKYILSTIDEL